MKAQEEEMLQNLEELQATQEDIKRREFKKDKYVEKSEDYTDVFVISNEEHQAFKKAKEQAVQQNDLNEPQSEDDLGTGEVKPAGM